MASSTAAPAPAPAAAPGAIELTIDNAVRLLATLLEKAQGKGAYLLAEAHNLKRVIDIVHPDGPTKGKSKETLVPNDPTPFKTHMSLIISGIHLGQAKGAFTLQDAHVAAQLVQYIENEIKKEE